MHGAVLMVKTSETYLKIKKIVKAKEEKKKLKLQNKTNKNVTGQVKGSAKIRFNATQILDESSEDEGNETFGAIGIYPNCEENYLQEESEDDSDTATMQAIAIDKENIGQYYVCCILKKNNVIIGECCRK